jgi:phosphoglycolate phosphatase-like HAD superfamily hydrolase
MTQRSPNPIPIFQAAMAKLGRTLKSEVVVIGDAPYDAEAAGKAGLRTIGFRCGGSSEACLRDAGCFAIYDDPADLLARYDESALVSREV